MWPNPRFPADLVTFTQEILNGKLHFFAVSASIGASTMFGNGKTIWYLGFSRSPRNKFIRQVFFLNILPHQTPSNPNDIFHWFLLVGNRTMQIKLTAALLKKPEKLL